MLGHDISELFNADFGDNSIEEEVAEQLLIMHEECLQSNYSSIERLRNLHVQGNAVSQSRQVEGSDDGRDSSDDDDDDDALMMDDDSVAAPEEMAVDRPRPSNPVTDADGWTVVPPRHGRLSHYDCYILHGITELRVDAEGVCLCDVSEQRSNTLEPRFKPELHQKQAFRNHSRLVAIDVDPSPNQSRLPPPLFSSCLRGEDDQAQEA
ncbi:hypothetical protein SETIT_9G149400v2 [Setaria italica]|uniref:Uncharacterized protein n=1 Tax=Setaria italica TaxID=4555 RepID=A0A368SGV1_SETIT|nr:hypothetical protein SETIT_9G149400v2 [Setaria italica]